MSKGTPKLVERKLWTAAELDADLTIAVQGFRDERLQEPLAAYLDAYDKAEEVIEELLRSTDDLANVQAHMNPPEFCGV